MHPKIRPSLLMFNNVMPLTPGMPGSLVQNSLFVRGEYTYETPAAGAFTPALIWGVLRRTRSADSGKSVGESLGAGRYADLGLEFDVGYSYMTTEFIKLGFETGLWMPGRAWAVSGSGKPTESFGGRLSLSTVF